MSDKYFVDTNVLVYAHDLSETDKRTKARALILKGLSEDRIVLSAQVLSEFFVTITQKIKHPLPLAKAREELEILRAATLVDIDADLVLDTVDVKIKHKYSYWDSLIIAAALKGSCQRLYSEDLKPGHRLGPLEIVNPFV